MRLLQFGQYGDNAPPVWVNPEDVSHLVPQLEFHSGNGPSESGVRRSGGTVIYLRSGKCLYVTASPEETVKALLGGEK